MHFNYINCGNKKVPTRQGRFKPKSYDLLALPCFRLPYFLEKKSRLQVADLFGV